jgi:hypothetical protein
VVADAVCVSSAVFGEAEEMVMAATELIRKTTAANRYSGFRRFIR